MMVIITSYTKVFFVLRNVKKRVNQEQIVPSVSSGVPRPPQRAPRAASRKRQATVTKNMFYVVCAFLLCMTPYSVVLVFPGSDSFVPYAAVILMLSSSVNPAIYATKHPDFGEVMRKIATCKFHQIPQYIFK